MTVRTLIEDTPLYRKYENRTDDLSKLLGYDIEPKLTPEQANAVAVQQAITQAFTALQTIIDTPQPTITTSAQAQTAVRGLQQQVKDMARVTRRLIRLVTGDFTGSD